MIAWNPLASVHTVHSAEALLGAELNMSMTNVHDLGPYRSYNEIPCFSSIVLVTLGLATALTCKHVPKGVVRTTRSHRCHREPLLSLVNFIGILFFEQSGQLCVVYMIKKAADGITK